MERERLTVGLLGLAEITSILLIPVLVWWAFLILFIVIGINFLLTRYKYIKLGTLDRWILRAGFVVLLVLYFLFAWRKYEFLFPVLMLLWFFAYSKIIEFREIRYIEQNAYGNSVKPPGDERTP